MAKSKKAVRTWRHGVGHESTFFEGTKMLGETHPAPVDRILMGPTHAFKWAADPLNSLFTVLSGYAKSHAEGVRAVETALRVLEAP